MYHHTIDPEYWLHPHPRNAEPDINRIDLSSKDEFRSMHEVGLDSFTIDPGNEVLFPYINESHVIVFVFKTKKDLLVFEGRVWTDSNWGVIVATDVVMRKSNA